MTDVELKPQVYKDPRPKEYFDRFHERVRAREPEPIYELVRMVTVLYALLAFRARGLGSENVPNGPVILAPNHASFMDHFFTGAFVRRRVQFMGKSQLFGSSPLSWIYNHGGVFPVRRGHHDEEAFISAFEILGRGGAVVMYCEGGRSRRACWRTPPSRVSAGSHSSRERPSCQSRSSAPIRSGTGNALQFPRVTIQCGKPFRFKQQPETTRDQQQAAADVILERIRAQHDELERLGHSGARRRRA